MWLALYFPLNSTLNVEVISGAEAAIWQLRDDKHKTECQLAKVNDAEKGTSCHH